MKKSIKNKSLIAIAIGISIFLIIVFASQITSFFSYIFSITKNIFIGLAFAYILNPLLKVFQKLFKKLEPKKPKLYNFLSVFLTVLSFLIIIAGLLLLILPQLIKSISELQFNSETLQILIDKINELLAKFNLGQIENIETVLQTIKSLIIERLETIAHIGINGAKAVISVFTGVLVSFFVMLYFLIYKDSICNFTKKFIKRLLGERKYPKFIKNIKLLDEYFGKFFIGKIIDSAIIMCLCIPVFYIARFKYPLLMAAIVGITNIIPVLGPFIGAVPCVLIVLLTQGFGKALLTALIILAIQQLDGNIIGPAVLKSKTGLGVFGIIVSISIMSSMFGLFGALIAVPTFAYLKTIIENFSNSSKKSESEEKTTELLLEASTQDPDQSTDSKS